MPVSRIMILHLPIYTEISSEGLTYKSLDYLCASLDPYHRFLISLIVMSVAVPLNINGRVPHHCLKVFEGLTYTASTGSLHTSPPTDSLPSSYSHIYTASV